MSTTTPQPATTPIPVQLSEMEFTAFILPHLSMPKYKSPLKRGRKTGNVLSKVLYHLDNTCQEKSRCRDGTPQLVLPSMIPPAPP